jgi:C_GCAxxG_C_C family probable redox protein
MDNKQKALDLFDRRFNCAQAVFGALAKDVGIGRDTALKAAACFGGGMSCGEACGAVTGALMALGIRFGSAGESGAEGKAEAHRRTRAFIESFKEKSGTIRCRELLGYSIGIPEDAARIREMDLYNKVCKKAVLDAVEIAREIIAQG